MAEHHQDEKKMTGLLRKAIVAASDARQESCPDPDLLAAYYERSLNDSEIARVENHFATCSLCQESLAVMARSEPPVEKTKASLWNWNVVRLWVTPLAVAAALFIVWLGRQSLKTSKPQQPAAAEVAQLKPAPLSDAQSLPLNGRNSEQLQQLAPGAVSPQKKPDRGSVSDLRKEKILAREMPVPSRPKTEFSNSPVLGGRAAGQSGVMAGSFGGKLSEKRSDEEARQSSDALTDNLQRDSKMARNEAPAPMARGAASAPAPAPPPVPAPQAAPAPAAPAIAETTKESNQKSLTTANGAVAKDSERDKVARQNGIVGTLPRSTQSSTVEGFSASERVLQIMVYSPDSKVMWRASGKGRIEFSKDGGRNWQVQFLETKQVLTAGNAPSTKVCWIVGNAGLVLLTTDGANWKILPAPTYADLVNVTAKDKNRAEVTASDGSVFETKDAGKTWQSI